MTIGEFSPQQLPVMCLEKNINKIDKNGLTPVNTSFITGVVIRNALLYFIDRTKLSWRITVMPAHGTWVD
jgi:hypothetical protein